MRQSQGAGNLGTGVRPAFGGDDAVGQWRQQRAHSRMRHQMEQVGIADCRAHRDEVVRDVVDEGDRARMLAAQLPDRRAFGGFGGEQRVGEAERVEMRATDRAMLCGIAVSMTISAFAGEPGDRLGRAVGGDLPIGLQREEFVEQRGDAVDCRQARRSRPRRCCRAGETTACRTLSARDPRKPMNGLTNSSSTSSTSSTSSGRVSRASSAICRTVSGSSLISAAASSRRCLVAVVALRQGSASP